MVLKEQLIETNINLKQGIKRYLPIVEIKDYSVMINGSNLFDQPIKMIWKHMIILEKLRKVHAMIT